MNDRVWTESCEMLAKLGAAGYGELVSMSFLLCYVSPAGIRYQFRIEYCMYLCLGCFSWS